MSTERLDSRARSASRRAAAGQALVETLVVAIALVPLAVLIVLLGKYQSIQSATIAASRSLAFDCAARPSTCSEPAGVGWLTESLRTRHFVQADLAIESGARVSGAVPGSAAAGSGARHPLWHDRAGRPLLERTDDVGGAVSALRFNAGRNTAVGRAASADVSGIGAASVGMSELLDRVAGPARFGLAIDSGLLEARVQLAVAPSFAGNTGFARLDPLALTLRARTAILVDSWQASGPRGDTQSVAARSAAGARLDPLREARIDTGYQLTRWAIGLMGSVGLEPSAGDFDYHGADPEAVPADRIDRP